MKKNIFILLGTLAGVSGLHAETSLPKSKPNIIYILCDDLGIGELGCYGQKKIETPNIDRLRAQGMLFTSHYSGSTVCAPSRCSLLTGLHTGHSFVRGNLELPTEGQIPLPPQTLTFPALLQKNGYRTACIGKWGLGPVGSSGEPSRQGFDYFFGYNCQRQAHSYYPSYLWENDSKVIINNGIAIAGHQKLPQNADPYNPSSYERFSGQEHAAELMSKKAIQWLDANQDSPFFLYFATPLPHVALQAPQADVDYYKDRFNDQPYLGQKGYLPCRYPRATYAAMVRCIDRYVGEIMDKVKTLGLDDNTLIFFSSDNGPTFNGGSESAYFNSAMGRRGLKCSLFEGGIRVPLLVRWPSHITPNSTDTQLSAFWDTFPTICDLTGIPVPPNLNGVSFAPALFGQSSSPAQRHFYWEDNCELQSVREGEWKLVFFRRANEYFLFNIINDELEKENLAQKMPEKVQELAALLDSARKDSSNFPLVRKGSGRKTNAHFQIPQR